MKIIRYNTKLASKQIRRPSVTSKGACDCSQQTKLEILSVPRLGARHENPMLSSLRTDQKGPPFLLGQEYSKTCGIEACVFVNIRRHRGGLMLVSLRIQHALVTR